MSGFDIDSVADELLAAYRTGKSLPPLTSAYPRLTVDMARVIEQCQTDPPHGYCGRRAPKCWARGPRTSGRC